MCFRITSIHQCLHIVLTVFLLHFANAEADDQVPEFFTFTFENDLFVGDDNGYTNGMGITFGEGPFKEFNNDNLPNWLHWLAKDLYVSTMENKQRGVAHMFFQRMQTPEDLSASELIIDDLPYAGLLAWQCTLYAWDDRVADQLSLYLGAVGPITLAEQSQTLIHELLGADEPKGWDNQIENEPIFKVEVQRIWTLYRSAGKGKQFDILGLWGAGIGNLESATKAGLAIRWGTNLRHSFPAFSLQVDRQVNPLALTPDDDFYLFLGARGGVIFNDILIDGNTFKDSHSLPLEHIQDQVAAGVVWSIGNNAFVFQISSISSNTDVINERNEFGALSYTHRF
ncbi:MAG: lipid A deacylase LpxR family protein [Proteobacteria bacterium]|nr:lipid A deacylase LpxR family protein [Pseudomonadota bacterium]